jgi:hypothetical protein
MVATTGPLWHWSRAGWQCCWRRDSEPRDGAIAVGFGSDVVGGASRIGREFSDGPRARTASPRGSEGRLASGDGAWPRAPPHQAGARFDALDRDWRDHRHRRDPGGGTGRSGRRRLDRGAGSRPDLSDPGRAPLVLAAARAAAHHSTSGRRARCESSHQEEKRESPYRSRADHLCVRAHWGTLGRCAAAS